jgi:hypothetical protein
MKNQRLAVAITTINILILIFVLAQARSNATQNVTPVVRARSLQLIDERGQVRAQFDVESSGEAVFRLRDAKGAIRVKLGASEDGSGLLLLNEATEPGVHILSKGAGASVILAGKDGQKRVITP